MHKLTRYGALYAVIHLLFGCAANQMASVPQLVNVPVGASLAKGQLQEIRLLTVDESRPTKSYIWISGKGYAIVNGGGGAYFWNSTTPPQLEIELPVNSCADLLPNPIPAEKALAIVGNGKFLHAQVSGIYVGKFVLDNVSSCELQTR
jgi:hypothetical protein